MPLPHRRRIAPPTPPDRFRKTLPEQISTSAGSSRMSPLLMSQSMGIAYSPHRQHRHLQPVSHRVDRRAADEVGEGEVAVAAHDEQVDAALGGEADELAADVAVAENRMHAADFPVEIAAQPRGELFDVELVGPAFDVVGARTMVLAAD